MSQSFRIGKVVDDDDLYILASFRDSENSSSDSAEAVDCNTNF